MNTDNIKTPHEHKGTVLVKEVGQLNVEFFVNWINNKLSTR